MGSEMCIRDRVKAIYDEDLLDGYPAIQNVLALMAEHPSVKRVETEKSAK